MWVIFIEMPTEPHSLIIHFKIIHFNSDPKEPEDPMESRLSRVTTTMIFTVLNIVIMERRVPRKAKNRKGVDTTHHPIDPTIIFSVVQSRVDTTHHPIDLTIIFSVDQSRVDTTHHPIDLTIFFSVDQSISIL